MAYRLHRIQTLGEIAAMDAMPNRGGFRGRSRGSGRPRRDVRPSNDGPLSADLMQAIEKMVERLCERKEDKKAGPPNTPGAGGTKEGRSRGNAPCFVCRKVGHWARECPDKTAAVSEDGDSGTRRGKRRYDRSRETENGCYPWPGSDHRIN